MAPRLDPRRVAAGLLMLAVSPLPSGCSDAPVAVPTTTTTAAPTTVASFPGNHAPTATIDAPRAAPGARQFTAVLDTEADPPGFGASVSFRGTAADPDGDAMTIEWFSSVEGLIGTGPATGPVWFHVTSDSETRTITMRVSDVRGAVTEATRQIIIFIPSDT